MTPADGLCYATLALNFIAMSRTRLGELRALSIAANLCLGAYAFAVDGTALAISAAVIIAAHVWAILRARRGSDGEPRSTLA